MTDFLSQEEANSKKTITELGSQILSLPVFSITPLGGRVSYNYEVNHKWILKLPAKGTQISEWIKQSKYMPALQSQLDYQIPQLKVQAAYIPDKKEKTIIGCAYPKIEGEVIPAYRFHSISTSQKINFFEQLSEAIIQLQQVNPNSLPVTFQPKIDTLSQFLFANSPLKDKLFKTTLKKIFEYSGINLQNRLLCHSDLHSENVCMNQNKIQGIIDFDMLSLGENWMEFSPHIYRKKELELFREIYQHHSGNQINPKAIKCMNRIGTTILFLHALGGLHIPVKKKPLKMILKKNRDLIDTL